MFKKDKQKIVAAYKGFDKDLKCREFEYKVGESYIHNRDIEICSSGFHACENPIDVFNYYPPTSRFCEVILSGKTRRKEDSDSKVVSSEIKIVTEINITEIIKRAVSFIFKFAKSNFAAGDFGSAAVAGDYGHAAASGNCSHAAASGDFGSAAASGNYGNAAASGDYGNAAASGDYGNAAAAGYCGHAAAAGNCGHAAASGNYGNAVAAGDYGNAAAAGDCGHAAASGNYGNAAATGNYGNAAATGNYGCSFAGFNGKAKSMGKGAIAICWYDAKEKRAKIVSGNVGENGIKPDTWYEVIDGKLTEVKE